MFPMQVTLQINTLEQLAKLLAVAGGVPAEAPGKPEADKPAAAPKAAPEKPKATPAPTPAPTAAPSPSTAADAKADAPAKKDEASAPPAYEALQQLVFKLAAKDKTKIPGLLAQFGVTHFKEVPADRRAEAMTAVNETLAGLEVA